MTSAFLFGIFNMWLREKGKEMTNKKNFRIVFRNCGPTNSYYTANCGNIVYTRKNLNSLECFIRNQGNTFYHAWVK